MIEEEISKIILVNTEADSFDFNTKNQKIKKRRY